MITSSPTEEQNLLQLVSAGNEKAFRQLVTDYSGLLYKFIYHHLQDRLQAEELVQDIFMKIWLTRESLAQLNSFRSYLFVVAKNHAFNAIKKLIREKNRVSEWQQATEIGTGSGSQDQEQYFVLIDEAIRLLPPQQLRAWILCKKQGLKYEQAAHEMQVSRDAIKKYLQYANTSIKKYILTRTPTGIT